MEWADLLRMTKVFRGYLSREGHDDRDAALGSRGTRGHWKGSRP